MSGNVLVNTIMVRQSSYAHTVARTSSSNPTPLQRDSGLVRHIAIAVVTSPGDRATAFVNTVVDARQH
jgi:hypothetical protein